MSENIKVRYEINLSEGHPIVDAGDADIRRLTPADRDALANLMIAAYVGTIDYEGETLAQALDEVDSWLGGSPLLDHSFGAVKGDDVVSAVLVVNVDEEPFIAIVMTDPDHKGMRLAQAVTDSALASLSLAGHKRVVLYITSGNTASERLFAALGARAAPGE